MKLKKKKIKVEKCREWKAWAIRYNSFPEVLPIAIFDTKEKAVDFSKHILELWEVSKVTVTEGWK